MSMHDIEEAKAGYNRFINMVKWATPRIAVIVFIVVLLIAS